MASPPRIAKPFDMPVHEMMLKVLPALLIACCCPAPPGEEPVDHTALVRPARPAPDDILGFVADPIPVPAGHFLDFAVTLSMMQDILRDYHTIGPEHWRHGYSHIGFNDRTGHFSTSGGEMINWIVSPLSLATL